MKYYLSSILFLLAISQILAIHHYVYEFGQDYGDVIYEHEGIIKFFKPVTQHIIPVPIGVAVTYVKVTVEAISPPKVDFSTATNQVTIAFSWTQISFSKYSILAKGVAE